jgi:hypothetical protein
VSARDHSKESRKRYKQWQRKRKRFQELREELQLAGELVTEPVGAIRDEQVDPKTQTDQALPNLIPIAIRKGWAVPEEKKPKLVDEMVNIVDNPESSEKAKVAAFNALRQADQHQFERDNPTKQTQQQAQSTSVEVNVAVGDVFDDIKRDVKIIQQQIDGTSTRDVQKNGDVQSVDATQSDKTKAKPATG